MGHHFLLQAAAPVLVFALEDGLQAGAGQAIALADDRQDSTDRKVPVPDYGVDSAVEVIKIGVGLLQQLFDWIADRALDVLIGDKAVKPVFIRMLQGLQLGQIEIVESDDKDITGHLVIPGTPSIPFLPVQ